jgi:glycosyltransferase involved in cell wall biosynthesis
MEEELCKANIAIAPMQSGSGMQNKILEAMAVKVPVITSTLGLGDLKAKIGKDLLIADSADMFIRQIIYLKNTKHQQEIGYNGYKYVLENHSWKNIIFSKISIEDG